MKIYLLFVLVFFISCSNGELSSDEMTQANSLYQHGKLLEKEGKADSAVIYYRKSLSLLDKSNEYHLTATVYNQLGELLSLHRYYDRAIELHKKAFDISNQIEDTTLASKSLRGVGKCFIFKAQLDSTLYYILKAYEMNQEINDKEELAAIYNNLSVIYGEMGMLDKAMEWNSKSMNITEDSLTKYRNYSIHSSLYMQIGKYDSAWYYSLLGLESNDLYIHANCLRRLSELARYVGRGDSLFYAKQFMILKDSIEHLNKTVEIGDAELKLKQQQVIDAMNKKSAVWLYWLLSAIVLINVLIYSIYRRRKKLVERMMIRPSDPILLQQEDGEQIQIIIKRGELYAELFKESLAYKQLIKTLKGKGNLLYNDQQVLMDAIAKTFEPYIEDLSKYVNLTREECLLCCLAQLKLTNQQCAACKNVSENAIRTQKSRIKNKVLQTMKSEELFDAIFNNK